MGKNRVNIRNGSSSKGPNAAPNGSSRQRRDGNDGDSPVSPFSGLLQHWYDEPPYESDPEDFLICSSDINE